jgi:uncharacterized membrane protein YeaQ/YmgE (transglycosylase-associated protein family)
MEHREDDPVRIIWGPLDRSAGEAATSRRGGDLSIGILRACCNLNRPRAFSDDQPAAGRVMSILWTIIIGFIAGVIAKLIMPGRNEPSGFILTTILGIIGAFVATYLGQAVGWYRAGEGAGLIGAVVGAVIVLFIWGVIAGRRSSTSTY